MKCNDEEMRTFRKEKKMRRDRRRLVKNQEGFEQHVDPADNPKLDFNRLTIGSNKYLSYVDDNREKRYTRISSMDWERNPWKPKEKMPLVRDQEGFSDHVDLGENPGLDFDILMTNSTKSLHYVDNNGEKRYTRISSMDWGKDPWKPKAKKTLVRDQEGFSAHVDLGENPDLDFDILTTGSKKPLYYVDDNGDKRHTIISIMDWEKNPWKPKAKKLLVRDQKGFSEHVDPRENPDLDFDTLTTNSTKPLHYVDDNGNKRFIKIYNMDWGGDPWKDRGRMPLVREQKGFSEHVDSRENPGLDFNTLTIGSTKPLYYMDDNGDKNQGTIRHMKWEGNPWAPKRKKNPLVREQKGFSEHVDSRENSGLDFNTLTTGSGECLHYMDDDGRRRSRRINSMDWGGNPWSVRRRMPPLVRNQRGFSVHVDIEENPDLDFNSVTIGSRKYLHFVDDNGNKRCNRICQMNWEKDPWKSRRPKTPLVRDQEGFVAHVDIEENPDLDFNSVTIGSGKYLHFVDDNGNRRCNRIYQMNWDRNPWETRKTKKPLVRDQEGFSDHVDLGENLVLNFDILTTGSDKSLRYVDDKGNKRCKSINKMNWEKNPWESRKTIKPLVRDQEGFLDHVDPKENPDLDFNSLTIGSKKPLYFVDDNGNKRCNKIHKMNWGRNPWESRRTKPPLVRDQEGFSEHVDLGENPDLDFDSLTISSEKRLRFVDNNGNKRYKKIHRMNWGRNPWESRRTKPPLVREQKGFSEHVDPEENPDLDFNSLTIRSIKPLVFIDDNGIKRRKRINNINWDRNPWESRKTIKPLVREQKGFSEHVDPKANPDLDFDILTTGSNKRLHFVDDKGNERDNYICYLNWDGNPWQCRFSKELVGDDPDFWAHCDETDLQKINSLKKCNRWSHKTTVKMHCDKGHSYSTNLKAYFSDMKESCPYCAGRRILPNETDAATLDPELELFSISEENDIDIHKISPKATTRRNWKCPYCGYRFKQSVRSMVNKHPKCQACKDTGIVDASNLNNKDDSHMIVVRNGDKDD